MIRITGTSESPAVSRASNTSRASGRNPAKVRRLAVAGEGDVPRRLGAAAEGGQDRRELGHDLGGEDRRASHVTGDRAPVDHLAVDAVEIAGLLRIEVDSDGEAARPSRADDVDEAPPDGGAIVTVRDALLTHGGPEVVC